MGFAYHECHIFSYWIDAGADFMAVKLNRCPYLTEQMLGHSHVVIRESTVGYGSNLIALARLFNLGVACFIGHIDSNAPLLISPSQVTCYFNFNFYFSTFCNITYHLISYDCVFII